MKNFVEEQYNRFYREIGFERAEVFAYLKEHFTCKAVLYPGCSIHITPSFYFEHVVYIDISPLSARFFSENALLAEFIGGNRKYKGRAHYQYLEKDFTKELALREDSFDLLISLFSGRQIEYCTKYLKGGGLILTNSLFSDRESLEADSQFTLISSFRVRKGGVVPVDDRMAKGGHSTLKKESRGFRYRDEEIYYIYKMKKKRK